MRLGPGAARAVDPAAAPGRYGAAVNPTGQEGTA